MWPLGKMLLEAPAIFLWVHDIVGHEMYSLDGGVALYIHIMISS